MTWVKGKDEKKISISWKYDFVMTPIKGREVTLPYLSEHVLCSYIKKIAVLYIIVTLSIFQQTTILNDDLDKFFFSANIPIR